MILAPVEAIMNVRYKVELLSEEREELETLVKGGKAVVRKMKRAQILLAADLEATDEIIAQIGRERLLSGKEEAFLVATACSEAPPGRSRWTLQVLAGKVVELIDANSISRETIRRRLKENKIKPWQHKMWCIPSVSPEVIS
jgi:hypothetical protein